MNSDLKGKVALITGAGGRRGIGRATALWLARAGVKLALMDLAWPKDQRPVDERENWKGVESVADEVKQAGSDGLPIYGDVTNEHQVEAAVRSTLDRFGQIDFLIASAGARPGADRGPVTDVPADAFRHVIEVNLTGAFLCCKAVGKHMAARKQGAVVIVSSEVGRAARPGLAAYSASKFGVIGLMQSFAHEMAPHQVRVNAVCPGLVDNARIDWSARAVKSDVPPEEVRARIIAETERITPLGRAATSENIASVIAFLCSSDSAHITGQSLGVDGGSRM